MRRFLFIFLALLMMALPAGAYWMFHENAEGPFADDPVRMMITGDEVGGLAFVCTRERGLEALYMRKEKAEPEVLQAINRLSPRLVLWVDGKKHVLPAEAVDNQGERAFQARVNRQIVEEVGRARRRIVAGVEILGEVILKHSFPVQGSKAAADVLLSKCEAK